MVFYRINGIIDSIPELEVNSDGQSWREKREIFRNLGLKGETYNSGSEDKAYVFISDITGSSIELGMIINSRDDIDCYLNGFLSALSITLRSSACAETTYSNLKNMLNAAEKRDFINASDDVIKRLDLSRLINRFGQGIEFEEDIIIDSSKEEIYGSADKILSNQDMLEELDRIYISDSVNIAVHGHPVHYLVLTDDSIMEKQICKTLCQALYMNNRINNRRVCSFTVSGVKGEYYRKDYQCLYKSCSGGSIIIRYFPNDDMEEDDHASAERECLEIIFNVMLEYRNDVQTIFCFPAENHKIMHILEEYLQDISFVRIQEKAISRNRAIEYYKYLAAEKGTDIDLRLCGSLKNAGGYSSKELHDIFNTWYNKKLKKEIFPQYSQINCCRKEMIEQPPEGSAYDELMKMPGIFQAKEVINTALNCYKAQKLFGIDGLYKESFSKHMVFTGNPGTAKTSVARLFSRILKENNLVTTGSFIEAGRVSLVGKFVGWTAKNVQRKFSMASGGVLFIDEAYSLLDYHNGSFGDEAINTIVQEMENHREDVIVIFAGYTDRMQEFLERNPGLKSRIAYHVPFPDYSTPELCEIANVMAEKMDLELKSETINKLSHIFDKARTEEYYGNGRYVRNVIEKARMKQMVRLLNMGYENVSKNDLRIILPEDVEIPAEQELTRKQIGFN